jgi:hypothetical protein
LQAGVECGCLTAAQAKRVKPYPQAQAASVRIDLQLAGLYSVCTNGGLSGVGLTHTMRVRRPAGHNQVVVTDVLTRAPATETSLTAYAEPRLRAIASAILWVFPYIDS